MGTIHQGLLESGEVVDQVELDAQYFGESTKAAVKHFQTHHTDQAGQHLLVDGIVGTGTAWAFEHPGGPSSRDLPGSWAWDRNATPPELMPVIDGAVRDIGLREDPDGSNDGPDLAKFHTGGNPWCALAVSTWYMARAGGCPFGRLAAVYAIHAWAKANGKLVDAADVRPGDLGLFLRAGGHGHIVLVVGRNPAGLLCAVEGNCSNAVRAMLRPVGKFQAFVRP